MNQPIEMALNELYQRQISPPELTTFIKNRMVQRCPDKILKDERKIKRYQLEEGDVVLACRGSTIKSAVFTKQQRIIIASANFIVIRPQENETGKKVLGDYIKIFFESPTGLAIIKSFQRGTNIMNINHADIMEMEIPLLDLDTQQQRIQTYEQERQQYRKTIQAAETRWNQMS